MVDCGELQETIYCVRVSFAYTIVLGLFRSRYRLVQTAIVLYCGYVQLCNHVAHAFLFCKTGLSGNSRGSRVVVMVCVWSWPLAPVSLSLRYCNGDNQFQ